MSSSGARDTLTLGPGTRAPLVLVLERRSPAAPSPEPGLQMETEGGLVVRYRVEPRGGGSGGEVTRVTGTLDTAGGGVRLSCTSQSEDGDGGRPCLALIGTLAAPPHSLHNGGHPRGR